MAPPPTLPAPSTLLTYTTISYIKLLIAHYMPHTCAVAPPLPRAQGLVEDVPLQNPNTLTHNRVYSKVGATRILQAEPAVLNFGGYSLGQVYSQKLLIRNVRASGTRFHIVPPSTPFFKVGYQRHDQTQTLDSGGLGRLSATQAGDGVGVGTVMEGSTGYSCAGRQLVRSYRKPRACA